MPADETARSRNDTNDDGPDPPRAIIAALRASKLELRSALTSASRHIEPCRRHTYRAVATVDDSRITCSRMASGE